MIYSLYSHQDPHSLSRSSLESAIKCTAVAWFSTPPPHPPFVLKMPMHLKTSHEQSDTRFIPQKKDITQSQISKIKIIKVIQNLWQCQHPKITVITPDRKLNALTDEKGFYSFFPYASSNLTLMQMSPEAMKHMWWRWACVTKGGPRSQATRVGRFRNMWCLVESWLSHLPLLDSIYNEQLTYCCLFCSFQAFIWQEHLMCHRKKCLLAAFAMSHSLCWCWHPGQHGGGEKNTRKKATTLHVYSSNSSWSDIILTWNIETIW